MNCISMGRCVIGRCLLVLLAAGLFILQSGQILAQESSYLPGTWNADAIGATLVLSSDGTFSYRDPGVMNKGRFQLQGNLLGMSDSYGNAFYYQIQAVTKNVLVLVDGSGRSFNYLRVPANQNALSDSEAKVPAERPSSGASKVDKQLVVKDGYTLTSEMVSTGIKFIQFVIGQSIRETEKSGYEKAAAMEFKKSPEAYTKDIQALHNALLKVNSLKDPGQIGAVRQAFISTFHKMTKSMSAYQKPAIVRIIDRYAPVVAFDTVTGLALTKRDLNAAIDYLEFCNQCYCQVMNLNSPVSNEQKKWLKGQMTANFSQMVPKQKQFLVSASLIWEVMKANWPKLNSSQKSQVQGQIASKFPTKEALNSAPVSPLTAGSGSRGQGSYSRPNDGTTGASPDPGYSNGTGYGVNNAGGSKKSIADQQADFRANQACLKMMNDTALGTHAVMLNAIGNDNSYWSVVDY